MVAQVPDLDDFFEAVEELEIVFVRLLVQVQFLDLVGRYFQKGLYLPTLVKLPLVGFSIGDVGCGGVGGYNLVLLVEL